MRSGYIIDHLTSIDIPEIVKVESKVIEIYQGVTFREFSKITPLRKDIDKLFPLRPKYKNKY